MWRQAFYLLDPTDLWTCRKLTEKIASKSDSLNIQILEIFLSFFISSFFFWPSHNKQDLSSPTTDWTHAPSSRSVEPALPGKALEGFLDVAVLGERVKEMWTGWSLGWATASTLKGSYTYYRKMENKSKETAAKENIGVWRPYKI